MNLLEHGYRLISNAADENLLPHLVREILKQQSGVNSLLTAWIADLPSSEELTSKHTSGDLAILRAVCELGYRKLPLWLRSKLVQIQSLAVAEAARLSAEIQRENHARTVAEAKLREIEQVQRIERISVGLKKDFISTMKSSAPLNDVELDAVAAFVKKWCSINLGEEQVDYEQSIAIASVTNHTQVVARAGSGKTTTIAIRLAFLMLNCHVKPSEILAVVFNREARATLDLRLKRLLVFNAVLRRSGRDSAIAVLAAAGNDALAINKLVEDFNLQLPVVRTFNSLAYNTVLSIDGESAPKLLDELGAKDLTGELLAKELETRDGHSRLRAVMMPHFLDSWLELNGRKFSNEELLVLRTFLTYETLYGNSVRSIGEKKIADWLFTIRGRYSYETSLYTKERVVFPDFSVWDGKRRVLIEFAGLAGDSKYDSDFGKKLRAYKDLNLECLVLYPTDIDDNSYQIKILDFLKHQSIPTGEPKSENEIWEHIRSKSVDRFRQALEQFVANAKVRELTPAQLRQKIVHLGMEDRTSAMFAEIATDFFESYLHSLKERNLEDHPGFLSRAIFFIDGGRTEISLDGRGINLANLRFISVDEHQDFSWLFERFLRALQNASGANIFAVGDGWQSINAFMGADPELFASFTDQWSESRRIYMPRNYRSGTKIVQLGNEVMKSTLDVPALPTRSHPSLVRVFLLDHLEPTVKEGELDLEPGEIALRRLILEELESYPDTGIAILSRTGRVKWNRSVAKDKYSKQVLWEDYITELKSSLPESQRSRVRWSTVHKFKGLQDEHVVIVDANRRDFPLINSDFRFQSIFGRKITGLLEEERRLFYVAVTRAVSRLTLITRSDYHSDFMTFPFMSNIADFSRTLGKYSLVARVPSNTTAVGVALLTGEGFSLAGSSSSGVVYEKDVTDWVNRLGGLFPAQDLLERSKQPWVVESGRYGIQLSLTRKQN